MKIIASHSLVFIQMRIWFNPITSSFSIYFPLSSFLVEKKISFYTFRAASNSYFFKLLINLPNVFLLID